MNSEEFCFSQMSDICKGIHLLSSAQGDRCLYPPIRKKMELYRGKSVKMNVLSTCKYVRSLHS